MGFTADLAGASKARLLFNCLDWDNSGSVTLEELDPESVKKVEVDEVKVDPTRTVKKAPEELLKEFRVHVAKKFGSTVRAWNLAFDDDGSCKVTMHEFLKGCKKADWKEQLKDTFVAMAGGDSTITIHEFAPIAMRTIAEFKQLLEERYGSIRRGWERCLNSDISARVRQKEFVDACVVVGDCDEGRRLGFTADHAGTSKARALFSYLDWDNSGSITLEELDPEGVRKAREEAEVLEAEEARAKKAVKRSNEELVKAFRAHVTQKFGSVVRAWHLGFDEDGNGKLSWTEFAQACAKCGWKEQIKDLFKALAGEDPRITIQEFAPSATKVIAEFRELLEKKYGSVKQGWEKCISADAGSKVRQKEFVDACILVGDCELGRSMGFTADVPGTSKARALFSYLDWDDSGAITLEELDPEYFERKRAEEKVAEEAAKQEAKKKTRKPPEELVRDFRAHVTQRYGSTVRAWKLGFDNDGNGKLNWTEFATSCTQCEWKEQIKDLFKALAGEDPFITIDEFASVAMQGLETFRSFLRERYGSIQVAWDTCINCETAHKVRQKEFCNAVELMGYTTHTGKQLFSWLDWENSGAIALEELDPELAAAQEAVAKAAEEQLAAEQTGEKKRPKKPPEELAREFRAHVSQRYGSTVRAWKLGFDQDGNGKLNWTEFAQSCARCDWKEQIKDLFKALSGGDSFITINEFAPVAMQGLANFRFFLRERYGSIRKAWEICISCETAGKCRAKEFCDAVKLMGYDGVDAKLLFGWLDWDNSGSITLEELDQ